jgi:hypothetical protein
MRGRVGGALVFAMALAMTSGGRAAEPKRLAHDVYFTLNDNSDAAKARLVEACKKYLTGHEGTVSFGVGTLVGENARPVNDRDFDVGLHIRFRDKAAHDKYQEAPRHKQFIEEQSANWKRVRVFDSWLEAGN